MSIKVVYNTCYGGFSISRACALRMSELGNLEAAEMFRESGNFSSWLDRTPRHDPALVQAVEELGSAASGQFSDLHVFEIKGNRYIIDEYDGLECVVEPEDIKWALTIVL